MLIIHSHYTDQLLVIDSTDIDDGLDDEAVFFAANRVEDVEDHCRQMPFRWQAAVRRKLDAIEMPSMSAGDAYVLTSARSNIVRASKCEPMGWSQLPTLEAEALIQRAQRGELEAQR